MISEGERLAEMEYIGLTYEGQVTNHIPRPLTIDEEMWTALRRRLIRQILLGWPGMTGANLHLRYCGKTLYAFWQTVQQPGPEVPTTCMCGHGFSQSTGGEKIQAPPLSRKK